MTDLEAIALFRDVCKNCGLYENCRKRLVEGKNPECKYYNALSAIQEKIEREERQKGCEWCESLDKKNRDMKPGDLFACKSVEYTRWGDGKVRRKLANCCPMCGRPLKGEQDDRD